MLNKTLAIRFFFPLVAVIPLALLTACPSATSLDGIRTAGITVDAPIDDTPSIVPEVTVDDPPESSPAPQVNDNPPNGNSPAPSNPAPEVSAPAPSNPAPSTPSNPPSAQSNPSPRAAQCAPMPPHGRRDGDDDDNGERHGGGHRCGNRGDRPEGHGERSARNSHGHSGSHGGSHGHHGSDHQPPRPPHGQHGQISERGEHGDRNEHGDRDENREHHHSGQPHPHDGMSFKDRCACIAGVSADSFTVVKADPGNDPGTIFPQNGVIALEVTGNNTVVNINVEAQNLKALCVFEAGTGSLVNVNATKDASIRIEKLYVKGRGNDGKLEIMVRSLAQIGEKFLNFCAHRFQYKETVVE